MNARLLCALISSFAALALASNATLAQRGGYGGGHGGGMGGYGGGMGGHGAGVGGYGGMPSGVQPGGRSGATPSVQPSERPGAQTGTERTMGGDRAAGIGTGKTPGELLQQNTRLSENLGKLLPAGTDLQTAAAGFRNLGEFVSAVHVSHNLGIPFADLKADMMAGDSLGEAIRKLRPDADSQVEARRAEGQAREDQGT